MGLLEDYCRISEKQVAQIRRDNAEGVQQLNSIYTDYKKGFSHTGTRRHLASIHPYWFVVDDNLKMYNKLLIADQEAEAMKYMRLFLADHPECLIKPTGKSNSVRINGLKVG